MCNCEEPRRSQDRMLMHQTLSKGWCHARSRLLLGLIVRVGGRLVEAQALFGAAQSWTASLAYRPRGHHPGHPRPVAPLQKRARFLALCSRTSAPLLPESLFPKPTQPQGALCGARFARLPTCSGPNALWRFGGLPCPGHYPHPDHREGKSFSQRAVCRASHLRQERFQDRVGLRVQGSTFCKPGGRDLRLRAGGGSLRGAPHRRLSHHRGLSEESYFLADKGFTGVQWERGWLDLYGALVAATPKENSKRAWAKSERRWASGKRQINRRGNRPTQGHLRPGAPQGQDAGWSFGSLGGQDGGLHLRAAAQRPAWATAAPPGRPFGLSGYASLVLENLDHE